MDAETRNPKHEMRNKSEIRMLKTGASMRFGHLNLPYSDLFRISIFGFLIWLPTAAALALG